MLKQKVCESFKVIQDHLPKKPKRFKQNPMLNISFIRPSAYLWLSSITKSPERLGRGGTNLELTKSNLCKENLTNNVLSFVFFYHKLDIQN